MSNYTPIFDRAGLQVSWMLNNSSVHDLGGEHAGSIKRDGRFFANGEHLGRFADNTFYDLNDLVVAFSDPTLAQSEPPAHQNCLSPGLAKAVINWSDHSWADFWNR